MGLLAVVNGYTLRNCLSIAITEMVLKVKHNESISSSADYCEVHNSSDNNDYDYNDPNKFTWDEELQGLILSSFYWGYLITHLPGGMLSEKFGGKYVLSLGLLLTSLVTLFIPLAVDNGKWCSIINICLLVIIFIPCDNLHLIIS